MKAKSPVLLHGHALRQATGVNGKSGTCPDRNSRQSPAIHERFRPQVYWDIAEVDEVLATTLAEQLFGEEKDEEVDTLAALCVRGSR